MSTVRTQLEISGKIDDTVLIDVKLTATELKRQIDQHVFEQSKEARDPAKEILKMEQPPVTNVIFEETNGNNAVRIKATFREMGDSINIISSARNIFTNKYLSLLTFE